MLSFIDFVMVFEHVIWCRDFCNFHKSLPCFLLFFAIIFYCP